MQTPSELLGPAALRAYQQHLLARQVSWSMFNQSVCALRFLYQVTLGRPDAIHQLPTAACPLGAAIPRAALVVRRGLVAWPHAPRPPRNKLQEPPP